MVFNVILDDKKGETKCRRQAKDFAKGQIGRGKTSGETEKECLVRGEERQEYMES